MRISGVRVPPGYLRWAAVGAGVLLLSVVVAVVAGVSGLTGSGSGTDDAGTRVAATISAGTSCSETDATETVTFTLGGREHQARFSGCGHAEGEPVEITVPATGVAGGELVVHAAQAAVGDGGAGDGLAGLLLVLSGFGGAGYAFLVRRGPRGTPLPPSLRLPGWPPRPLTR